MSDIPELLTEFHDCAGLDENQAKTAIYYGEATHHISQFDWFPALAFIGAPGTGKSVSLDIMAQITNKPYRITCHSTMTPASLRDELVSSKKKVTAIIEECDLYPNRKQLQSYIINRVDKKRTAGLAVKEQVETETGVKEWKTRHKVAFGATVIHDRNSLDDLAAESRAIVINTAYRKGNYRRVRKGLSLPTVKLAPVPSHIQASGRAFDTWLPLMMVASGFGDEDWLLWALFQIQDATENLVDGHLYEEKMAIFAQVIKAYCDNTGMGLVVNPKEGLAIQTNIVEPLRREMPYIGGRTVTNTLRKMGLKIRRHWGTNKIFTSREVLIKIADEIGYEDDVLKE